MLTKCFSAKFVSNHDGEIVCLKYFPFLVMIQAKDFKITIISNWKYLKSLKEY